MPEIVTAYRCQFNCHRKVVISRKLMAKHEEHCFRNPKMKACQTCGNLFVDEGQRLCVEFEGLWDDFKKIDCPKWKPLEEENAQV